MGCDLSSFTVFSKTPYFNPRTHVGCDCHCHNRRLLGQDFNPRTHVGCDAMVREQNASADEFQSTHPRGVRLPIDNERGTVIDISIHAPTWGATRRKNDGDLEGKFQSTHPRGVRRSWGKGEEAVDDFNPRTHVGCDFFRLRDGARLCDFNPRTHVGCDPVLKQRQNILTIFQSTHPRGVRLIPNGEDRLLFISIHAPTWGATPQVAHLLRLLLISIHAPTWGATAIL